MKKESRYFALFRFPMRSNITTLALAPKCQITATNGLILTGKTIYQFYRIYDILLASFQSDRGKGDSMLLLFVLPARIQKALSSKGAFSR
jgi:hypothetical protein